jgi:DNA-binding transcriptional ArsR family regulator
MLAATQVPEPEDVDDLWRALASPWRRRILDALRDGPRTTGELDDALPELSRYAVMQHLEVLVGTGVVLLERRGRHRFNHLNPVALRAFHERWVTTYADATAGELTALRHHLEEESDMTTSPTTDRLRIYRLEAELRLRATPERVFRAMTDPGEIARWFPYTYGRERVQRIVLEPRVGGLQYEDWGDGRGRLYGHVTEWDPPLGFSVRSRLHAGTTMDTTTTITPQGGEALLRSSRVIVGPLSDDDIAGIRFHGDLARFEEAIRALVEAG